MPHVLLYEFLTGGGLLADPDGRSRESLRREGAAMLAALAADFAAIDGVTTTVILDSRQRHERSAVDTVPISSRFTKPAAIAMRWPDAVATPIGLS